MNPNIVYNIMKYNQDAKIMEQPKSSTTICIVNTNVTLKVSTMKDPIIASLVTKKIHL